MGGAEKGRKRSGRVSFGAGAVGRGGSGSPVAFACTINLVAAGAPTSANSVVFGAHPKFTCASGCRLPSRVRHHARRSRSPAPVCARPGIIFAYRRSESFSGSGGPTRCNLVLQVSDRRRPWRARPWSRRRTSGGTYARFRNERQSRGRGPPVADRLARVLGSVAGLCPRPV